MGRETGIQWCDASFNPWHGCEKVSPACAHCYAEPQAARFANGVQLWGPGHQFKFFGDKHWSEPLSWARTLPTKLGRRPRVFCASMGDVFEEREELDAHRWRLFHLIEQTPELDWLILTKRPEAARDFLFQVDTASDIGGTFITRDDDIFGWGCLPNVWVGVSIENARFTWRADVLREIPAAVRFISAEPLLGSLFKTGPATLAPHSEGSHRDAGAGDAAGRARNPLDLTGIDWVIIGGESGPKARPFHLESARQIIEACRQRECPGCGGDGWYRGHQAECYERGDCVCDGAPEQCECRGERMRPAVFVKQLGARPVVASWAPGHAHVDHLDLTLADAKGGDWDEWPADLRIREFPESKVAAAA